MNNDVSISIKGPCSPEVPYWPSYAKLYSVPVYGESEYYCDIVVERNGILKKEIIGMYEIHMLDTIITVRPSEVLFEAGRNTKLMFKIRLGDLPVNNEDLIEG